MRAQPLKTTLILSVIFTAIVVAFVTFTSDDDPTMGFVLLNAMLVFGIVFFTMRVTNRLTSAAVNRWAKTPRDEEPPPPPPESSSARPEHAQRRRSRRRPRGRRHRA